MSLVDGKHCIETNIIVLNSNKDFSNIRIYERLIKLFLNESERLPTGVRAFLTVTFVVADDIALLSVSKSVIEA